MAGAAGVCPDQFGDVNAGGRACRNHPGCGFSPISTIHQTGGTIRSRVGLVLRKRSRGQYISGDQSRAGTAVIAKAVDIQAIVRRVGFYLESNRLPPIDVYVRRKPLNAGVTRTANVPLAGRIAWFSFLDNNRIRGGKTPTA